MAQNTTLPLSVTTELAVYLDDSQLGPSYPEPTLTPAQPYLIDAMGRLPRLKTDSVFPILS